MSKSFARFVGAGLALPPFFIEVTADKRQGQGKPSPYETVCEPRLLRDQSKGVTRCRRISWKSLPPGLPRLMAQANFSAWQDWERNWAPDPLRMTALPWRRASRRADSLSGLRRAVQTRQSTLINALIGSPVLPVGYIPVTAVPTVIRHGTRPRARVQARDGTWRDVAPSDLDQYVSEEFNPENAKGIAGVEVFLPSAMLSTGMCFVDTPGLGSVFTGNTAATNAFIPHIDAALVVVGADPPLAGEELTLVETVGKEVQNLILVMNKADRTTDAEREAAAGFTIKVLEKRLKRAVGPVFEVSATERMENCGPERDWAKLLAALDELVEGSGHQLIQEACDRGVQRLSEQLLAIIAEEREALARPIEDSERRIAAMKQTLAEAERSMREVEFLWIAEQRHLSDLFVERHKAYLASMWPQALEEFDRAAASMPRRMGPLFRYAVMRKAQEIAQREIQPWLKTEQAEGEKEYRQVATRFVQMANDFLKKLADAGVRELARMPHALDPETGFRVRSEYRFRDMMKSPNRRRPSSGCPIWRWAWWGRAA